MNTISTITYVTLQLYPTHSIAGTPFYACLQIIFYCSWMWGFAPNRPKNNGYD
jgi:hypothetical protein